MTHKCNAITMSARVAVRICEYWYICLVAFYIKNCMQQVVSHAFWPNDSCDAEAERKNGKNFPLAGTHLHSLFERFPVDFKNGLFSKFQLINGGQDACERRLTMRTQRTSRGSTTNNSSRWGTQEFAFSISKTRNLWRIESRNQSPLITSNPLALFQ